MIGWSYLLDELDRGETFVIHIRECLQFFYQELLTQPMFFFFSGGRPEVIFTMQDD